jgi:hypothetical protein
VNSISVLTYGGEVCGRRLGNDEGQTKLNIESEAKMLNKKKPAVGVRTTKYTALKRQIATVYKVISVIKLPFFVSSEG